MQKNHKITRPVQKTFIKFIKIIQYMNYIMYIN